MAPCDVVYKVSLEIPVEVTPIKSLSSSSEFLHTFSFLSPSDQFLTGLVDGLIIKRSIRERICSQLLVLSRKVQWVCN